MGNTATDVKQESADKVEAKETKPTEKKSETKPATSAKTSEKKAEEKKAEEKKAEKKPAEKKEEKNAAEKKAEEKPTEAEKAEKTQVESTEAAEQPASQPTVHYPYDIILKRAVSTFRGPSVELLNKPFGGKLTVLGCTGDFYKVQFVRAGFGSVTAYVLCKEVERCIS